MCRNLVLFAITASFTLSLAGCGGSLTTKELEEQNNELASQLAKADERIVQLEEGNATLSALLSEQQRLAMILDSEKSSRTQASSELRLQVRQYMQSELDRLKDFLLTSNLFDYVGGELIERGQLESEPVILVDLANPIPRKGTLTGVAGLFSAPSSFRVAVLRPVNGRYVVIWQSTLLEAARGEIKMRFPVSVGVESGDVIAYEFPETVGVSFDRGTGDMRLSKKGLALGATVSSDSLKEKNQKRAYSLGVFAILE